jgi:hypothetical protein
MHRSGLFLPDPRFGTTEMQDTGLSQISGGNRDLSKLMSLLERADASMNHFRQAELRAVICSPSAQMRQVVEVHYATVFVLQVVPGARRIL